MSIKLMTQVWDNTELKGNALLIMLSLADHANDDGICWPGMPRLAKRARVSLRQAQRIVHKLEEDGYIAVDQRGDGKGKRTVFRINVDVVKGDKCDIAKGDTVTPLDAQRVTNATSKGDILSQRVTFSTPKGDIAPEKTANNHQLDPSIEPSSSTARAQAAALDTAQCGEDDEDDDFCRAGKDGEWLLDAWAFSVLDFEDIDHLRDEMPVTDRNRLYLQLKSLLPFVKQDRDIVDEVLTDYHYRIRDDPDSIKYPIRWIKACCQKAMGERGTATKEDYSKWDFSRTLEDDESQGMPNINPARRPKVIDIPEAARDPTSAYSQLLRTASEARANGDER